MVNNIVHLPNAVATRAWGQALAGVLRAGDLVLLTGDLGAGKTTLAQGIGQGLGVRGPVASPTFIIARFHPSLVDGPGLVHVDAYRITSLDEIDALDLDASLADCVTLVEWGEGLVEQLAADRLEIHLTRPRGNASQPTLGQTIKTASEQHLNLIGNPVTDPESGLRTATIQAQGPRWQGVALPLCAAHDGKNRLS